MTTLQDCLDVLTEVIQSQKGTKTEPKPTDYFMVITNVITTGGNLGDKLGLMLQVFRAVIPESDASLVASQFQVVMKALMAIARSNAEDSSVLSTTLSCIGEVLKKQETSDGFWSALFTLQALNALLAFLDDENSKVRKASHEAINNLLDHHHTQRATSLPAYFTEFALGVMKACSRSNYHRSHCLVVLFESSLVTIPEKSLPAIIEQMLKLQNCEIPKLTSAIFRTFDALFQHPKYSFSIEMTYHCLFNQLLSTLPQTSDIEAIGFYLNAVSSSFIHLLKNHSDYTSTVLCLERLNNVFSQFVDSEFSQVHCSVALNLKRISSAWLQTSNHQKTIAQWCNENQLKYEFHTLPQITQTAIPPAVLGMVYIVSTYEKVLLLKYQFSWVFLLESLRSLLDHFHHHTEASYIFKGVILKLSEIYQAIDSGTFPLEPTQVNAIQETVGKVLQTIGLIPFLQLIPMFEIKETSIHTKDWVIELLQRELRSMKGKISDFVFCVLPIAGKIHKLIVHLQSKSSSSSELSQSVKLLKNKIIQLWSLLPEICYGVVVDIDVSIVKVMPIFQQTIQDESDYPEIKLCIVQSLKNIADSILLYHSYDSGKEQQLKNLFQQQIAPMLLPMLLQFVDNFSTYSDERCRDVIHCIHQWAQLSSDALIQNIAKRLLQLVLTTTTALTNNDNSDEMDLVGTRNQTEEKAAIWMAILLGIVPMLTPQLLQIVFKTIQPLLTPDESPLVQKRAFNLLHSLVINHSATLFSSPGAVQELLTFLQEPLLQCQVSGRNSRLKVIEAILETVTSLKEEDNNSALASFNIMQAFELLVNDLFHCLKDANTKTRFYTLNIVKIFSHSSDKLELFQAMYAFLLQQTNENQCSIRSAAIQALSIHLLEQRQWYNDYVQDRIFEGDDDSDAPDNSDDDDEDDEENNDDEEDSDKDEPQAVRSLNKKGKKGGAVDEVGGMLIAPPSNDLDNDPLVQSYFQLVNQGLESLSTICSLLAQESSEQVKAVLVYIKIIIVMGDKEQLQPYLALIFPSITKQIPSSVKSKFLNKIRAIFRKLLKKFPSHNTIEEETGELLRSFIPASDIPLLDYIIKENRKSKKKKLFKKHLLQQKKANQLPDGAIRTTYDRMAESDAEDSDDDDVMEEGNEPAKSQRGEKTLRGKSKAGTVVSKHTKMTKGSMKSRFEADEDEEDEEDKETDYRFQSSRKVKGLRAKDYTSQSNRQHANNIKDLVNPNRRGGKKRSYEDDDEEDGMRMQEDAYQDDDASDDEDETDEAYAAETLAQNNAFNRKRMRSMHVDNPFAGNKHQHQQRQPPAPKGQNKRQKTAANAAASSSAAPTLQSFTQNSLTAAGNTGSGGNVKEDDRYQVVITKDGKVKVQEKSFTEQMLSAAPTSLDQLTNKKMSRKGSRIGGSIQGGVGKTTTVGARSTAGNNNKGQKKTLRLKEPGIEYRAKKAGGDVWKKGQRVQPHAYIPLDPRLLSKKHQATAIEHFGAVVNNQNASSRKKLKVKRK